MAQQSFIWPLPRLLRILLGLSLGLVITAMGASVLLEWKPKALVETPIFGPSPKTSPQGHKGPAQLDLLTWNIGYAGLEAAADAFTDGGRQVGAASKQTVLQNLDAIISVIQAQDSDVILLQEVDDKAKRTFNIDQVTQISKALPDYRWARARNFLSPFVPVPLRNPLGRVQSGLLSLSRVGLRQALRHQLPGDYKWPVRVFHLKRCLHELRFPASDGKDWVILNLHLSAFDQGGFLRLQQMNYLRELMLKLAKQGQHVVVGGDWNQAFPGLNEDSFSYRDKKPAWFQLAPSDWTPAGWHWVFDPTIPSLRANNKPYIAGENFVTTVDGWLIGPDLKADQVACLDLGYSNSDHNPVRARVSLVAAAPSDPTGPKIKR